MNRFLNITFALPVATLFFVTGCYFNFGDETSSFEEDTVLWCEDNIDNDEDGLTDCDDPNCWQYPWCDGEDGDSGPDADSDTDTDTDTDTNTDADAGPDSGQSGLDSGA